METSAGRPAEAERRHHVERAFAELERRGSVVTPFARAWYGRCVAGELTLGPVCEWPSHRAGEALAQARAAFGWVR